MTSIPNQAPPRPPPPACWPPDKPGAGQPRPEAAPPSGDAPEQAEADPTAQPPRSDNESATLPCCLVWLTVEAVGLKNLGPRASSEPLAAEVRINGQLVGRTPLREGLPAGDYRVEVVGPYEDVHAALVPLRPGEHRTAAAEVLLPLNFEEKQARDAWRQKRVEQARAEKRARAARERAEAERARAAAQKAFQARHASWETETRPLRKERATKRTYGWVSLGAGLAFAVTGTAFEIAARNSHQDARDATSQWQSALDQQSRDRWAGRLEDAQDRRDVQHVLGLTGLGLGVAGLATGSILLLSAPEVPPEPQFDQVSAAGGLRLELVPWVWAGSTGGVLRGTL